MNSITLPPMALFLVVLAAATATAAEPTDPIEVLRVPNGGVQPQTAVGADGSLHLVFLKGEPGESDVWYARRAATAREFTKPTRVNSVAGSAVAVGTIRGAQLVLDSAGVPVVAWNGTGNAKAHVGAPLLVARMGEDGKFAPQQDVIRTTAYLDGGGSIARGRDGQVFAVWHAAPYENAGETNRGVYVASSTDGGKEFGPEVRIDRPGDGACGCCGLKALGRADGALGVLYRAAGEGGTFRDMTLLFRTGEGEPRRTILDRWSLTTCPMSSASLSWMNHGILAAWETRDEVQLALVDAATGVLTRIEAPAGTGKRKHPSIAVDAKKGFLLAWVEGTGWNRGGSLAWQHYDAELRPTGIRGRRDGVPVWGLASAFVVNGRFGVIY